MARAVASGVDRNQRFTGVRRHDDLELVDPHPIGVEGSRLQHLVAGNRAVVDRLELV